MTNLKINREVLDFINELNIDISRVDFSYVESEVNGNNYNVSIHTKDKITEQQTQSILKKYFSEFTFYSLSDVYSDLCDDEGCIIEENSVFSHYHLYFSFKKSNSTHI